MCHLQSLHELLPCRDVGHVDRGAEGVQHFHLLQDVFAAGGPDDEELAALSTQRNKRQERENERGTSLGKLWLTTNEKW